MVDGMRPEPMGDLARVFMAVMVAGAIVLGWINNRDRRDRGAETSGDGLGSDDGPHHGGWWGFSDADGGHDEAGDDGGGDGGH